MSRITMICAALAVLVVAPGCRTVKMAAGLGETVTQPDPGTPERIVQEVLKAASNPDRDTGWAAFEALLHSEESDSQRALQEWRDTKFDTIRRKAPSLVQDPASFAYKMMDYRKEGDTVQIFVRNAASDMPSPCRLKPDPAVRGAWRVFNACF